ncbi:PAS domain S-box protein [Undibacterium fentianense]|uniref:Sensor protein FixL n=1 Tax=Undibacterium fentianense TaxID=2828728 RepID=A0A941IDC8_9BURK|nr:PAS domain S-box protein [Undibacterium fentianense]MBR7799833.1 PAS domain S-box protein [Undibacterium fentianense]
MRIDQLFLSNSASLPLLTGEYDLPLVALSVFVAVLAGVMAFQLAEMARTEKRQLNRQIYLLSGAFVLGSGVWSMHFIGMLAFSVCSTARYDRVITILSMLPSFLASWVALLLIAKDRVTRWQLVVSGVSVGAGIGVMHYSGMAAVHQYLILRFDPLIFGVSIVVAVALSILALWLRFRLIAHGRLSKGEINLIGGVVIGIAISGMHYTGMQATHFLTNTTANLVRVSNLDLALSIAAITTLAILITVGGNVLLRYRSIYQRMVQTEARTRTIVETAVDGIITIDSQGCVRDFNSAAEHIFGWTAKEVIGKNIRMLMPEPQRGQHDDYILNYLRNNQAKIIGSGREVTGLRKDGNRFPLRLAIGEATLQNETLFVGFITDISKRKQMEEALHNSEKQYRSLIGNLPGIAFRCRHDNDWSMLFVSDAVERLTGWKPADFVGGGKTFAQLLHPDDQEWTAQKVKEMLTADKAYMIEYRIIDRSGREHWVSESASGVRDDAGNIEWIDGVIIDITDSKRRNAEFEGIVDAIGRSLAVVEFDLFGTILHANQIFLQLTGYQLDDLVGKHHAILCAPSEANSVAYQELWETLRQGLHTSGEFHRFGKDGQEIWIHGSYNPIFDPEGRPYKIIKFASDLSARHKMEQDLREAKVRAELAAAAKNTFLANMSHEIRTPMNAVIGFTEVLLSDPATDTQRRHLTTVRNSARSLLTLLNDILDTAKLEHGAVELEIKDFSLRDICMQVLATLRINAQAKALPLILDYPDSTPEYFRGDALRIQQILLNLVGNAIKFTEKGQVVLHVHLHQEQLHLTVQDTGIGIASDRISHIFDPFAQADASMSRRFGGTGLGTTIARQLIELMHGKIWVESELGVGSQFHVQVPLPIGSAVPSSEEQTVIDLPPLHILAADDVPQNLELLEVMLSRLGHKITTASNGEEVVERYRQGRFDIILMDVQMPVMNGLEAAEQIRVIENQQNRHPIPIIAFSASVLEADVKAALAAGMDGFAHKPVDLLRLSQEIARLLNLDCKVQTINSTPQTLKHPVHGSVIDWSQGQQLWGSEQRHQQAIHQFLGNFRDTAPRLRQLLDNPSELAAQIHKLKGAAGNLALTRVSHLSETIETELSQQHFDSLNGLIDRLADELHNVNEAIGTSKPIAPTSEHTKEPTNPIDHARLLHLLQELDDALKHGELAEDVLTELASQLPATDLAALDQTINSFDFEAARQLVLNLQNHYRQQG